MTAFGSGVEALEHAARADFDALVTDVMMPGMGGPELAARLREARPRLPVVYVSGFAGDQLEGQLGEGTAFLAKPFDATELVATLAGLIASAAG